MEENLPFWQHCNLLANYVYSYKKMRVHCSTVAFITVHEDRFSHKFYIKSIKLSSTNYFLWVTSKLIKNGRINAVNMLKVICKLQMSICCIKSRGSDKSE